VGALRCEVTRAARRCSIRAWRERWPERRRRRGAEGPAASAWAGVGRQQWAWREPVLGWPTAMGEARHGW
jgi:hypothetical protein